MMTPKQHASVWTRVAEQMQDKANASPPTGKIIHNYDALAALARAVAQSYAAEAGK